MARATVTPGRTLGSSAEIVDQVGHRHGSLPGGPVPEQDGFVLEDERLGEDEAQNGQRVLLLRLRNRSLYVQVLQVQRNQLRRA
jgi:hypothetical protein